MPIKWTPENDQHLLIKILDIIPGSIDYAAVAAAWSNGDEKPTAKAISERISKLRKWAKADGSIANNGDSPAPGVPQKRTPRKKKATPAQTPKRKRQVADETDAFDSDGSAARVKEEVEESPTKKVKAGAKSVSNDSDATIFNDENDFGGLSQAMDGAIEPAAHYMTPDEISELW